MNQEIRRYDPILGFFGEWRFLSNFWPCKFTWQGKVWDSTEHAYQAYKSEDIHVQERIRLLPTPGATKRAGKTVKLRPDWPTYKLELMTKIVYQKFKQNKDLAAKLLATEDAYLEETNTWGDVYWGVCNGVGENNLGLVLMEVRNVLRNAQWLGAELPSVINSSKIL